MTKQGHAWTHGMTTLPTLLAECCCGIQRHEIDDGTGRGVIWYLDMERRWFSRELPSCTRAHDDRESRETIARRIKDSDSRGMGARGDDGEMR